MTSGLKILAFVGFVGPLCTAFNCGNQGGCGGGAGQPQIPFGGNCGQRPCPQQNPWRPPQGFPIKQYVHKMMTTTPACTTPCPPASTTPSCLLGSANRICARQCNIGAFTMVLPQYSCGGLGIPAVCCGDDTSTGTQLDRCIQTGFNRVCAERCPFQGFNVPFPQLSCVGNGIDAVCCGV